LNDAERMLNKVAVVTGAGSGIGRAIAAAFLNEGAKVVLFGRTRAPLDEFAETAPARVLVVEGDVTKTDDLEQLARTAVRRFARVDVLVPAAGMARYVPFVESSRSQIAEQFEVNFTGAAETVRVFLPSFTPQAVVLFIGDAHGQAGHQGLGIYHAGKAALASLARTLTVELAPRGIRVNCLSPGPVDTALWTKLGLPESKAKKLVAGLCERTLDGNFVSAAAVAETAVFLASDAASHIRGQEIVCDGGFTIR
jgi:NAD(P)-dependent dehydrogenase (short-subunit alcohol dehydrogenase family)